MQPAAPTENTKESMAWSGAWTKIFRVGQKILTQSLKNFILG